MKQIISEMITEHIDAVEVLRDKHIPIIERIATLTGKSIAGGGCVYLCGNGGSAADCQHIAGELVGRFRKERRALPAVALTTDSSVLTCLGNDYDFGHIFARQVEAFVQEGDVLWAFSTSGTSENILKAAKIAKQRGAIVVAFTGIGGSSLEEMANVCLCTHTTHTSTSQEVHQLAYHIICNLIEDMF